MQRAHKIRLNPTAEQQAYFRKAVGTARFVYNWGLAEVKRMLDDGHTPLTALDLKARFNIQVDLPRQQPRHQGHAVGVDVGVKELAVDSDGQRFENQKPLRSALCTVKRLARRVSRRVKGSKNRGKAIVKLARAHYRVACLRSDAQHKATSQIARKAALIGLEDLNVAGMLRNRRLSQALSDAGLSELHRQLRYKAEWYGGQVVRIGRFFPSSRLHNGCDGYKADLDLMERVWTCPLCGEQVDRDLNAARNIRDEALRVSAVPGVATSAR